MRSDPVDSGYKVAVATGEVVMISDSTYQQLVANHGLIGAANRIAQIEHLETYRTKQFPTRKLVRVAQHYKGEYDHTIGKANVDDAESIDKLKARGRTNGDWSVVVS